MFKKKEIQEKVSDIKKKFIDFSQNVDEMDKKLENVGKKLNDISSSQINVITNNQIKRAVVPDLKEMKNGNDVTIPLKNTPPSGKITTNVKININSSVSLPTAEEKLSGVYVKTNGEVVNGCKPSSNVQRKLQETYNYSKVAAAVKNLNEKLENVSNKKFNNFKQNFLNSYAKNENFKNI